MISIHWAILLRIRALQKYPRKLYSERLLGSQNIYESTNENGWLSVEWLQVISHRKNGWKWYHFSSMWKWLAFWYQVLIEWVISYTQYLPMFQFITKSFRYQKMQVLKPYKCFVGVFVFPYHKPKPMTDCTFILGTLGMWIYGRQSWDPMTIFTFKKRREPQSSSRWWQLKYFWNFHPETWGNDPIWRAYFSNGVGSTTNHQPARQHFFSQPVLSFNVSFWMGG